MLLRAIADHREPSSKSATGSSRFCRMVLMATFVPDAAGAAAERLRRRLEHRCCRPSAAPSPKLKMSSCKPLCRNREPAGYLRSRELAADCFAISPFRCSPGPGECRAATGAAEADGAFSPLADTRKHGHRRAEEPIGSGGGGFGEYHSGASFGGIRRRRFRRRRRIQRLVNKRSIMAEAVEQLVEKLPRRMADRLGSLVVLYGSAAGGDHQANFSDYNVLCILSRITLSQLRERAHFPLVARTGSPSPLLLTEGGAATSTDCFAIEFMTAAAT